MPKIVVAMIVKNEAAVLERCLTSILEVTPHIVVVDTGSTDNTATIARAMGATVVDFTWVHDFSAARNFSFREAERLHPDADFLLWVDADDVIEPKDAGVIKSLVASNPPVDAFFASYVYSQDEFGNTVTEMARERLVRAGRNFTWEGAVHETIIINGYKGGVRTATAPFRVIQKRPANRVSPVGRNLEIYSRLANRLGGVDKLSTRDLFYSARELSDVPGRSEDALARYIKFIDRPDAWWEDKASACSNIAHIFMINGKMDDARQMAFKAVTIKHTLAEAYCQLGLYNVMRTEWAAAANWYEIALTCEQQRDPGVLAPRDLSHYTWIPHMQLAMCYYNLGKLKKAQEHNDQFLKLRPAEKRAIENKQVIAAALNKRPDGQGKRLNLGCGNKKMPGYVNCDLYPSPAVDEAFSLDDIPYANGTIAALHSEHALEHLPRAKAELVPREWARVLKPGGELLLKLPDLELCCQKFLESPEGRYREWYHHTIFGYQQSLRPGDEPDEAQFHKCGFTKAKIRSLLEDAGFIIDFLENYDGYDTPSIAIRAVRKQASLKIGWFTEPVWQDGSVRIRALNMNRWLRAMGYDSELVTLNDLSGPQAPQVLVTGKRWDREALDAVKAFRAAGGKVVLDLNEDYFGLEGYKDWVVEAMQDADLVLCCSNALAQKVRDAGFDALVIEDAVETIPELSCEYKDKERLSAVWLGYGGNAELAERLRPILDRCGYDLTTVHEWANADVQWNRETWPYELIKHDIAIAPQREAQTCKSNNKLTTYQALGLPVVASPLPAYLDTGGSATFMVASNDAEWENAFNGLKEAKVREAFGKAGRQAAERFRLDNIGQRWLMAVGDLIAGVNKGYSTTTVFDIVIPTYNNPDYLKVCLESVKTCTTSTTYNVIVVDVGTDRNADHEDLRRMMVGRWCTGYQVIRPDRKTNFSESNNLALRASNAPYVCLLNDDTIVSYGWLNSMEEQASGGHIVGPFSNCDQGWLHYDPIVVEGVDLHPAMKLEEVKDIIPAIREYRHGTKEVTHHNWIAAYCWVMKRDVLDKVGLLDEGFINGCEDLDFCKRAEKFGIRCVRTKDSFVFHFGGKSRKVNEEENYERHHAEDSFNHQRLSDKWAKPTVVFYSGPAFERWAPTSLSVGGIGGSETALIHMASEIKKLGHRVLVFNDCGDRAGVYGGVTYAPYTEFPKFVEQNYIDVFISSRDIWALELPIRAGRKIVWTHDIWLHP